MLVTSPRRGLLCVLGVLAQKLAGAAPVLGRHHHHSVRIGALREDNTNSSSTVATSDNCGGDPILSIAYTADGQCNTLDAATCQIVAKSPECSYMVTMDGTKGHLGGIWAGAGCQGTPVSPPADYALNLCTQPDPTNPTIWQRFVATAGSNVLTQQVYGPPLPPPAPPAACAGDPIVSIAYTADGQCNTPDAGTCQIMAKSPECSYMMTTDGTMGHLGGIWAGAGCQGTPVTPPFDIALNLCTQMDPTNPTIWQSFVATAGSNVVTQLVFQAGGGAPPPPSPPYTGRVPTAAEVAAAVQPALDAVSQRFNASFSFGW
eukprot:COSAG01_NODE_3648_length_5827_cov_4.766934_2_plen_317_part_00